MSSEELLQLVEILEVLHATPEVEVLASGPESAQAWLSRAGRAVLAWSPANAPKFDATVDALRHSSDPLRHALDLMNLLYEARLNLLLRARPTTVAIPHGRAPDPSANGEA